jgi:asparagine synthase (glutamine-hydrolysing)
MKMASGHDPDRFVLLSGPDVDRALAGCHPFEPTEKFTDSSGRHVLLTRLRHARLTKWTHADRALLTIGPGSVPAEHDHAIRGALAQASSPSALEPVLARLPGVFHIILIFGNAARVQGTATGTRLVFHTRLGEHVAASDRSDVLGRLAGSGLDETTLALHLLDGLPHPLADRTPWSGVHAVPPGEYLEISPRMETRTRSWWTPPIESRSLAETAPLLRAALEASVAVHVRGRRAVLSELSGGHDSTAVTVLAASPPSNDGAQVHAVTVGGRGMNTDEVWAGRAAARLPGVRHQVLSADSMPSPYDDLESVTDVLDEPSIGTVCRATMAAIGACGHDDGADVHLTGHGGDHLFVPHPALARDLLRSHPIAGSRRIAAYRALFGWSAEATIRQLADRRGYGAWLGDLIVNAASVDITHPVLSWGTPVAVPDWLTSGAVKLIDDAVRTAAAQVQPLAPTPGRHAALDGLRQGARLVRSLSDISAGLGLPIQAPLLDDRLVELAWGVDLRELVDPWSYKPVLQQAMRGTAADAVLSRRTKDESSLDIEVGVRENAATLRDLWSDSRLGALGLVDERRLRELSVQVDRPEAADGALTTAVGVEVWLRAIRRDD